MKKYLLILLIVYLLSGCGNKYVKGTEATVTGVVTDRAMSVVIPGGRESRAYITIVTDDGSEIQYWLADGTKTDASIGDTVTIESVTERYSEKIDLSVATKIY